MSNMNIIDAYIKFNGELIIILSGLSGSHKTSIAKSIEKDFKLHLINIEKYTNANYNKIVQLNNGIKLIDWDDIESFDWDKINEEINKYKKTGIILCGPYFPDQTIKSKVNFHIQLKVQKQNLIDKRYEYVKNHPEKFNISQPFDQQLIANIINQVTYPHFLSYGQNSKIDKYINSKDLTENQIYDEVADFLFFKINEYLKEYQNKHLPSISNLNSVNNKKSPVSKLTFDTNISKSGSVYDTHDTDDSDESSNSSDEKNKLDTQNCSSSSCDEEPIFLGEFVNEAKEWEYRRTGTKIKDYDFPNY